MFNELEALAKNTLNSTIQYGEGISMPRTFTLLPNCGMAKSRKMNLDIWTQFPETNGKKSPKKVTGYDQLSAQQGRPRNRAGHPNLSTFKKNVTQSEATPKNAQHKQQGTDKCFCCDKAGHVKEAVRR